MPTAAGVPETLSTPFSTVAVRPLPSWSIAAASVALPALVPESVSAVEPAYSRVCTPLLKVGCAATSPRSWNALSVVPLFVGSFVVPV